MIAYLLEIRHGGSLLGGPGGGVEARFGAIPHRLTHAGGLSTWKTLLTSMFVHASFLALLGNMVFLAIFGPAVEARLGRLRFCGFYLLAGLVALGAQVAVEPASRTPALGASGAIAAVLGGYIQQ